MLPEVVPGDAVLDVARHVAVHHVQQTSDAHPVSLVDEVLEILGVAASRRHGEGVGDVVAERAVVRVLHHRHQLHGVVAASLDPGQDIVGELAVGVNLGILAAHAHVSLVDARRGGSGRPGVLADVLLARRGIPVHAVVVRAELGLLRGVGYPRGDAVDPPLIGLSHLDLDARAVLDGSRGQGDLPDAEVVLLHRVRVRGPLVEVADEERGARGGRPLAVRDLAGRGLVEAELEVPLGELLEGSLRLLDASLRLHELLPAVLQVALVLEELLVDGGAAHAVDGVAGGAGVARHGPRDRGEGAALGVRWVGGGGGGSPGALGATLAVRANHAALTRVNRPARYDVGRDRGRDRAAPDGHFGAPEKTEVEAVGGLGRSPRGGALSL